MKIFISPPFGSFRPLVAGLRAALPNAVPILGSYTLKPRPGKVGQAVRTLRYDFESKGWRNSMGLRNPGLIEGLNQYYRTRENGETVLSLAILDVQDVKIARQIVPSDTDLELNISCPNSHTPDLGALLDGGLNGFLNEGRERCMVKLPHMCDVRTVRRLHDKGFTQFHCSNTRGGLSGESLVTANLKTIEELDRAFCGNLEITGGGGILDKATIDRYLWFGSEHVSISTVCLNPLRLGRLVDDLNPGLIFKVFGPWYK